MSFIPALVRTPVNSYEVTDIISDTRPDLVMDFEQSPSAKVLCDVQGESNAIVNRSFSSRVWAEAWVRHHEAIDRVMPAPKDRYEGKRAALERLDHGLTKTATDYYELFDIERYKPFIDGSKYQLVSELQASVRCALFRPDLEAVAAIGNTDTAVRMLRELTDTVDLDLALGVLGVTTELKRRFSQVPREEIFRKARVLAAHGISYEESGRLLARYPYDKCYELFAKVGIADDYLDELDG